MESNGGYFMNVILVDLIGNPSNYNGYRSIAWPFLRNLALLESMRDPDLYEVQSLFASSRISCYDCIRFVHFRGP